MPPLYSTEITVKSLLIVAAAALALAGCGKSTETSSGAESVPKAATSKPNLDFENLRQAVAASVPYMKDISNSGVSQGAAMLAIWGADHMKWEELQDLSPGKYGLVMKDPDSQRGLKICTSGHVIEIAIERSESTKGKIFIGGMFDDIGRIYRFIAVGSTGEIMANNRARFCGVITGQEHYSNSAGGTAHAIHVVGMFDLPENKSH